MKTRTYRALSLRPAGRCLGGVLPAAVLLCLLATRVSAQVGDITLVSPDSATQGATNLTVTFTLTALPPLPQPGDTPTSITIGSLVAADPAWNGSQASAVFTIPAGESPGAKNCTVSFPPLGGHPEGPSWAAAGGFTVTGDTALPPCEGYNLFAPISSTTTYLLDNSGTAVHTWPGSYRPGKSVYLLEDGTLLRTATITNDTFTGGGAGGRVERFGWDGSLVWAFDYNTADYRLHHDVAYLPNSNILMIAWEMKSEAEAIAAGRDPGLLSDGELWPDHIIEVAPTGTYGGDIVWEWHAWDHLVQDYDITKANFGTVTNHPERIDINFTIPGPQGTGADWHHINAVAYNEELDQVVLSVRNFSEIWIIDHSTTTAEAAGHTGGNSGMGGDLLYRWGNPHTYGAGTADDQQLFAQHDAEWIGDGLPGAGNILIFNNGQRRPDGDYSSIDEIVPPVAPDGTYTSNSAFGPAAPAWTYVASPATNFYAQNISGSQRLSNGNTLICDGPAGRFFEVTAGGDTVWEYNHGSEVFRVERYATDYRGFDGTDLDDVSTVPAGSYAIVDTGQDTCHDDTTTIAAPTPGAAFYGQDAQYAGNQPSYTASGDGLTVYDNNTGLTWQQSPDTDGNGSIDADDKLTWAELQPYPSTLNVSNYAGHSDWRLPTIKELYSLIDFRGTDPPPEGSSTAGLVPFIDTNAFAFAYGDTGAGERIIDSQWASDTLYVADGNTLFGVNFADGRIKGYGLTLMGQDKTFFAICCRGNTSYGINQFVDNGDGTITDHAAGLMWQQADSPDGMNWEDALAYAEGLELGGYRDWRLPNAKELQSILDYTRSPDTTSSAAIDPLFSCSIITNLDAQTDYPFYWSSTTHLSSTGSGSRGAYVAFGRGLGEIDGAITDIHGAGCQRSDPKDGDPNDYPQSGQGPQGDVQRVFNHVRCVRAGATEPQSDTDDDGLTDAYEYNYSGNTTGLVATADNDEDGTSNEDEEGAGTIPTDPTSVFAIVGLSATAAEAVVTWSSELGRTYAVQCSTSLVSDAFSTTLATGIRATPPLNTHTNPAAEPTDFYRVFVE